MKKIKKILIANRGEIALRIINACAELGIKSVAIYSTVDADSMHTLRADEAVLVGEAPSSESYLKSDLILQKAIETKCDAVHPGFGFLAENSEFAKSVIDAGLIFIGPSPEAIQSMGNKTEARKIMIEAGVPVVPGTVEPITDVEAAKKTAIDIGFPVLIKAVGGGGGKGMRKVDSVEIFEEGFKRAVSEARSAFGNPDVYLEKYVEDPRHIEFQVLADNYGNTIHLLERECSIQRRHQKVIEEAPSTVLTEAERKEFGEIAVKAAISCKYSGAGTVEFLMDKNRNFYFLEMNTRIQVEHPVTEEVTGVDIVREQIRIAEGHKLTMSQDDVKIIGHAIECRIYAEDPLNDFFPSIGKVVELKEPSGKGIRIESAVQSGTDISIYYDPMISKLICHAPDRESAINKMKNALSNYLIVGVKHNISFCHFVLEHEKFISGDITTNFISDYYKPEYLNKFTVEEKAVLAAVSALHKHNKITKGLNGSKPVIQPMSNWKSNGLKESMEKR